MTSELKYKLRLQHMISGRLERSVMGRGVLGYSANSSCGGATAGQIRAGAKLMAHAQIARRRAHRKAA